MLDKCDGLPGHDVPDHGGRAGQVVVAEVEGAQGGHVGEGGGGDEGQLVGGHVEAGQLRQVEAGQDGERGVGQIQHLHTELQTWTSETLLRIMIYRHNMTSLLNGVSHAYFCQFSLALFIEKKWFSTQIPSCYDYLQRIWFI